MTKEQLNDAATDMVHLATRYKDNCEELAAMIAGSHPMLQQDFMRLCVAYIAETAQYTPMQGAQNFDAIRFAKKVMETTNEEDRRIRF